MTEVVVSELQKRREERKALRDNDSVVWEPERSEAELRAVRARIAFSQMAEISIQIVEAASAGDGPEAFAGVLEQALGDSASYEDEVTPEVIRFLRELSRRFDEAMECYA